MQKLILAYHGVEDCGSREHQWIEYGERRYDIKGLSVRLDLFEKQLAYLRAKGYKDISLREFFDYQQRGVEPDQKSVAITFDDGFKNFFDFAAPLLKKYGYRATIFLITDKIGKKYFLSWQDIFCLQNQGFCFGAHTCSHPALTELPLALVKQEIEKSKKIIEQNLAKPVDFFCYPYGKFNSGIQRLVKQAGFLAAVVTPSGPGVKQGAYSLKRIGINRNNSMFVFGLKESGFFSWLREQKFLWKLVKKF